MSDALDVFDNSEITYTLGSSSVSYKYSGERWSPSPKSQSKLLRNFGYASVIYAAANAERIEPRAEDFKPRYVRDAAQSIRNAAIFILGNDKFNSLKVVNVRRGVSAEAFLMPDQSGKFKKTTYYSEKNFSLGEICVLKLLRQLETCPVGSLVLIDELELALHPRAQIGLLEYLERISFEKGLTVIFSTHSANLIKTAKRDNFYFIERNSGKTQIIHRCYPTYALGLVASKEERSPDAVIYVEDEQAQLIVESLIELLMKTEMVMQSRPTIIVSAIGTFDAVIAFLNRSKSLLPETVKQCAIVDGDVKSETLEALKKSKNYKQLSKIQSIEKQLHYLPWTPEVGICEFLLLNKETREMELKDYLGDFRISLSSINRADLDGLAGGELRKKSKVLLSNLIDEISNLTSKKPDRIRGDIAELFAKGVLSGKDSGVIKELLLPILRH